MYGQVLGKTAPVAGVTLLPATGNNRPLFFLAAGLIVAGVAILIASSIAARKNRAQEA